jgi:hypothetical protein
MVPTVVGLPRGDGPYPIGRRQTTASAYRRDTMGRCYPGRMDRFPRLAHQSAGGGIECCGFVVPDEGWLMKSQSVLRCDECGVDVGTISTGILNDLVTLAIATDLDTFVPDPDHINALPGPLRKYIHDLETRADPAGDVAEIALLKEDLAALWARIRELEGKGSA